METVHFDPKFGLVHKVIQLLRAVLLLARTCYT